MTNGLAETNGFMTTDGGRKTVAYMTRCALSAGDSLIKKDQNGVSYTFPGGIGLCPAWKNGGIATNRTCQNMISACMMAHVNTAGVNVPLWLTSQAPAIGWGYSPSFPQQEGTFFGNIMMTGDLTSVNMTGVTGPVAYFCEGAGITAGVVAGRLTEGATNVPYKNPYGTNVKCDERQAPPSGQKSHQWPGRSGRVPAGLRERVLLPERRADHRLAEPELHAGVRQRLPLQALDDALSGRPWTISNNQSANGTKVQQWTKLNVDAQKFNIGQVRGELENRDAFEHQQVLRPHRQRHRELYHRSKFRTATAATTRPGASRRTRTMARFTSRTSPPTAAWTCPTAPRPTAPQLIIWDCNNQGNQRFKLAAGY